MNTVKAHEFRLNTPATYNRVMMTGPVEIVHRDRPNMVLMTVEQLEEIKAKAAQDIKQSA